MQDKNICPKCGKEKEEFAVAWGWEYCYNCSSGRLIFENANGYSYFVVAGDEKCALLRNMVNGGYVIARGLRWGDNCWEGGSYFLDDEFELAVKTFLEKE